MRFVLLLLLALPSLAHASDLDRLRFGAEGELYIPAPIENATPDGDRLRIRSVEVTAQAAFDDLTPGLAAKLTLGGDDTSGDMIFNLREGFLIANFGSFALRAGKFYLPIGILNQTRRSAWSMISAPRFISLFFTENGVVDTGADVSFTSTHFKLRIGATNGYRFDSSVTNTGLKPLTPTHFARPALQFALGASTLELAADYVGRVADDGGTVHIAGLDASLEPTDTTDSTAWRGQLEAYHRYTKPAGLAIGEELGAYVFAEKGVSAPFAVGLRLDAYKIPTLKFANGDERKNLTLALSPVVTYRGRDHLRAQISYTILKETRDGDTNRSEQAVELRLVSEFGEIPKSRTP